MSKTWAAPPRILASPWGAKYWAKLARSPQLWGPARSDISFQEVSYVADCIRWTAL
jgi:hypothetical protein